MTLLILRRNLSQTRVYPGDPPHPDSEDQRSCQPGCHRFQRCGRSEMNSKRIIRTDPSSLITETEGSDLLVSQSLRIETSSIDSFALTELSLLQSEKGSCPYCSQPLRLALKCLSWRGGTIRPADSAGLSGGAGRTEAVTDSEGIALKGNRSSTGGSALFLKRYLMAAVLLILTVLLLLAPFIVKSAGSLRFGRRRADLQRADKNGSAGI